MALAQPRTQERTEGALTFSADLVTQPGTYFTLDRNRRGVLGRFRKEIDTEELVCRASRSTTSTSLLPDADRRQVRRGAASHHAGVHANRHGMGPGDRSEGGREDQGAGREEKEAEELR